MLRPYRHGRLWNRLRHHVTVVRVARQGPPLDSTATAHALPHCCLLFTRNTLPSGFFRLRSSVVVCHLEPDLASVFTFAVQTLPEVILASSRHYNIIEVNPGFAYEVCSLVLAEDGDLEVVVVR